ncbi:MAG: hypothetical protein HFH62_00025 [Lachnospiraceae bacterium]|nr:hypothetical protein [Lachnospiraceae bacterium]
MKKHNTPHRHRVIKTLLTEEQYARLLPFPQSMMNYNALFQEVRAATAELAALRFEVLQKGW